MKLLRELLEDALQQSKLVEDDKTPPSSSPLSSRITNPPGYSTSYCLPVQLLSSSNNSGTLGLHRHQPAQSCEHILNVNATAPSGFYWIDPNLGCSSDAILVHCNFTSNETCIHPNSTEVLFYFSLIASTTSVCPIINDMALALK